MSYFIRYLCGCIIEGHVYPPVKCPVHGKGVDAYKEVDAEHKIVERDGSSRKRSAVTYFLSSLLGGLAFRFSGTASKA
jgi:hypothetical protein